MAEVVQGESKRAAPRTAPEPGEGTHGRSGGVLALPLVTFLLASGLLCWNLGDRYLWQDEAATAVLAERMLAYGRPLAYDGENLITMDRFRLEEARRLPTADESDAVRFFVDRGDFKEDTTWIGQPWGQFLAAGLSLQLLERDTFSARLPFALAGALLAALLSLLVWDRFGSVLPATLAVVLLLANTFWVLHVRQCRYYALSSLLLMVTLYTYLRWQEGRRWGIAAFIAAAWMWFQQDFGSIWPVIGVLALDAVVAGGRARFKETVAVFAGLALALTPFLWFYELIGRIKEAEVPWAMNFWSTIFQVNQFQLPLLVVIFVASMLFVRRKDAASARCRRLVFLCLCLAVALVLWMPAVSPYPFYRYVVPITSLSVIVVVYGIVELARLIPYARHEWIVPACMATIAVVLVSTNFASWPANRIVPEEDRLAPYRALGVRPELRLYVDDLRGGRDEPNRGAVEFLREHLRPGEEVLCNYEDIPLMFYLPNRVRGGIGAFRVSAPDTPPRFLILRKSVSFYHGSIYHPEIGRHRWKPHVLDVPDIAWGNNPDPRFARSLLPSAGPLTIYERVPAK